MKYHVTYYYLDNGMDGIAQEADYGIYEAESKEEAMDKAARDWWPEDSESGISWVKGCLTAEEILMTLLPDNSLPE